MNTLVMWDIFEAKDFPIVCNKEYLTNNGTKMSITDSFCSGKLGRNGIPMDVFTINTSLATNYKK